MHEKFKSESNKSSYESVKFKYFQFNFLCDFEASWKFKFVKFNIIK